MKLLDSIKTVTDAVKKYNDIPLMQTIVSLQTEAWELLEQVREKDKLIAELKKTLELKEKLHRFGPVYFTVNKDGEANGLPYCPKCFEVDGIACHMIYGVPTHYQFRCPTCKLIMGSTLIPRLGELKPKK